MARPGPVKGKDFFRLEASSPNKINREDQVKIRAIHPPLLGFDPMLTR
jgi:hypothetical protein